MLYIYLNTIVYRIQLIQVLNTIIVNYILDDLKTLVYSETGIPCCQQTFSGWPNNHFPSNKDTLSKFNLPDKFNLNLTTGIEDTNNQEWNVRYYDNFIFL